MLNTTFDLITLAASNSLVVFCFCNLIIIAILLVSSSKPGSEIDEEKQTPLPGVEHRKQSVIVMDEGLNSYRSIYMNAALSNDVSEASSVEEVVIDNGEEGPDGEDDDLRRRVEEFIEKVNKGWKAEKLRISASGC